MGFRIKILLELESLGFIILGLGCRIWGLGFRV
jgi:hypothetical protein